MKCAHQKLVAAITVGAALLLFAGVAAARDFQISGTVKNPSSVPFAGAIVEVINPGDGTVVVGTTTDSDGYYAFSPAGGTYNVRVTPPTGSGFQISVVLNRVISGDAVLDFVLVPAGVAAMSGRILDCSGNGLGGLDLFLIPSGGGSEIHVTTDDTGAYDFQVAPGDYILRIYGSNIAVDLSAPRNLSLEASPFTLSVNTIADINIPAYQVTVHVQDPAGNPVANTAINSNNPYAPGLSIGPFSGYGYSYYPAWLPAAVTNAAGDAVMWLFPNTLIYGTYTFTATPPSGSPLATTNLSDVSIANATSLTIKLAAPITLSGRILDGDGRGLGGLDLFLIPSGGGSEIHVTTDDTGAYDFQVAPGDYILRIYGSNIAVDLSAPRNLSLEASPFTLSVNTIADIIIPAYQVTVHVQDPAGKPVANTAINSNNPYAPGLSIGPFSGYGYSYYPAWLPAAVTNAAGDAVMWLFPNTLIYGTYTFTATPPSGSPLATTNLSGVSIANATSLTIKLAAPITLSGRILDGNGRGLGGLDLFLIPSGGGSEIHVTTDDTGAYDFQVAPGDYILRIYGSNIAVDLSAPRNLSLEASPFTLSVNTIADINIPAYQVTVHVQDPAGNPVANTAINSNNPYAPGLSIGPFSGYGYSYYPAWLPAAVTNAAGDAVMWLFPNTLIYGTYTFTATPPSGSPFVTFNITNVSISSDKDIIVVLQFVHVPPVTIATLSPSGNGNGEYSDPTAVTLTSSAFSGFTVSDTYYSIDAGSTCPYTGPFTVSGVGPHTIRYWSVDNGGVFELPNTRTFIINVKQLTALGTAGIWLGLKNSDDVGTKFDLLAEVLKNGSLVGRGELDGVAGGSSGFNNAVSRAINLALSSPVNLSAGDTLSIRLSVRIAVGVTGHRSGTARLWFNDPAANSRFGATIGGTANDYLLLDGFALGFAAGQGGKKTIDVFVDRAVGGNPFKPFGTWSKIF